MLRFLCAVAILGCAPLNPATLPDACRSPYNSCLNSCQRPQPPPRGDPSPTTWHLVDDEQVGIASCTNDCNERAKSCQLRAGSGDRPKP
jgi:hypothetical protein